jgi:tRNA threonylcarbamoyladenosine modification (KEOPS) complex  Pcc1 subunit
MTALAATYGFTADKGATFTQVIKWKDNNNNLINLSGYSAEMVIREKTTATNVVLTLSTDNGRISLGGEAGTITLSVSADDMDIDASQYTYTLELTSVSNEVTRLLMGAFVVRPDVFRI